MFNVSRRHLLQAGTALGIAGLIPQRIAADESDDDEWDSSPDLEKYVQSVPILEERTPEKRRWGIDYHEVTLEEAQHEFHPKLDETTIWGFDGQFPGPIITGCSGKQLNVRFDNSGLPSEHLFEVDTAIGGTTTGNYVGYDGPVPEVRTSTHFHGLNIAPESDGQADMWTSPSGETGPRFATEIQEVPNRQSRLTSVYHDHTRGISRLNNYAGLVGPYYIRSFEEKRLNLPDGDYDVPLVLADRAFTEAGELFYPDQFVANFAGDTATVNGAVWPYLEVEPRRYRFRIHNVSNARTYDLRLAEEGGHDDDHGHDNDHGHGDVPTLYQISPGHGFLEEVVSIGPHGTLESLVLAPFERADVIVDFSDYAGETFTVTNGAEFPYKGGMDTDDSDSGDDHGGHDHGDGDHPQIPEIMQIRVEESVSQPDTSAHPTDLRLPKRNGPDPKAAKTTRTVTMQMDMGMNDMTMGEDGGEGGGMNMDEPMLHTLNGKRWGDPVEFKPQLGTTEIWELVNTDDHTHPIHLHLVEFEVIGRGEDGEAPPLANERGGKDVVRVDPGETVRIAVKFKNHTGMYPFHCHVLEHEEHDMMRPFEVVTVDSGDDTDDDDCVRPGRGRSPRDRNICPGYRGRGRRSRGSGPRYRGRRRGSRGYGPRYPDRE